MTDTEKLVAWRGEYDPATPLGAARFLVECVLAPAIILRGAMHTWGTFIYAEAGPEEVREDMDARYRPVRFAVANPEVPRRTEIVIRFWSAFFALAFGLVIWSINGVGASAALLAIAAANWGLLVADPLLFAAEQQFRSNQ